MKPVNLEKTFQTFLLSDENKNIHFLGLRDMSDKSASTTLDTFKKYFR